MLAKRICVFCVIGALFLGGEAAAADWPQWRGPRRDGVSQESGWSADWPEGGPKVLWRKDVGMGFAAVAVAGLLAIRSLRRRMRR